MLAHRTSNWKLKQGVSADIHAILGARLVLIIGPSGVGKSSIASKICKQSPEIVMPICTTTRSPRTGDAANHFDYVSMANFNEQVLNDSFFCSRTEPSPQYGYRFDELMSSISSGKLVILMFRHSGLLPILLEGFRPRVILLEGDVDMISNHSKDVASSQNAQVAERVMSLNRSAIASLSEDCDTLCLMNDFSGRDEIRKHATLIVSWLSRVK